MRLAGTGCVVGIWRTAIGFTGIWISWRLARHRVDPAHATLRGNRGSQVMPVSTEVDHRRISRYRRARSAAHGGKSKRVDAAIRRGIVTCRRAATGAAQFITTK